MYYIGVYLIYNDVLVSGVQQSDLVLYIHVWASQVALVVKNPIASAEDMRHGFVPRSSRSPGKGHGKPLQDSC